MHLQKCLTFGVHISMGGVLSIILCIIFLSNKAAVFGLVSSSPPYANKVEPDFVCFFFYPFLQALKKTILIISGCLIFYCLDILSFRLYHLLHDIYSGFYLVFSIRWSGLFLTYPLCQQNAYLLYSNPESVFRLW